MDRIEHLDVFYHERKVGMLNNLERSFNEVDAGDHKGFFGGTAAVPAYVLQCVCP